MDKLWILILLFSFNGFAQKNVEVNGVAPGAENGVACLKVYEDQITYTKRKLASCQIDSSGHFQLSVKIHKPQYAELYIELHKTTIILVPEKSYTIEVAPLNYDSIYNRINPFLEEPFIEYEFVDLPEDDLNKKIAQINEDVNQFLIKNFYQTVPMAAKIKVEGFIKKMNDAYASESDKFLKAYVRYKMASLDFMVNLSSRQKLFREFLYDDRVLYDNPEYMDFFNQFFDKYLTAVSRKLSYWELKRLVNKQHSYVALMDSLGRDTVLVNEVVREMVVLKSMYDLYYNQDFYRDSVLSILSQMVRTTKFSRHKKMAENMIGLLTKLRTGTEVPEFFLQDQDKLILNLEHKKGKFVYLNFWSSQRTESLKEIELLNGFYEKYKHEIEFVSVSVDRKREQMLQYLQGKEYGWHFVYYDKKDEIIEDFGVKALPLFVMIDREGKVLMYPAKKPSEDVESYFIQITKPTQEKRFKMFEDRTKMNSE